MESKRNSSNSSYLMSKKRNDSSSVVDREKVSKTDGSSTPTEAKRRCPTKHHGKGVVSDERCADVMFFADVTPGPHEAELRFRLIHFWEARNPHTKVLIGEEMLLIDEKGTAIQGFIPSGRVDVHVPHLKAGCIYKLRNFFGSGNKENFRVSDHNFTVTFSWNLELSLLEDEPVPFPEDRFRFHTYNEFRDNCDLKGDLYDYVGHMKLVEGKSIADCPRLDVADIASKRHVVVHVQTHDGPLMKMFLWDKAGEDFCQRFKSNGSTLGVLLVTTVNPKRLGGTLDLTSMSSSRVFMDNDVDATRDYVAWLSSNSDIANRVNAEVVTKPETVTISELFAYMKQESAKVAWFECTATIDDVFRGSAWYYISCDACHLKATKGATSLMCTNKKCKKVEVNGVPEYLAKLSVYDKSEQAVFVVLGESGRELTGKHASELVANYFENNESVGADEVVPVPQALLETVGQTRRFLVKVLDNNLTGKRRSITVTKVFPPEQPEHSTENAEDDDIEDVTDSHATGEVNRG